MPFSAYWNGSQLVSQTDWTNGVWTKYSFNVVGTGSDTISFSFTVSNWYSALDDVSVDSSAPEPASMALLAGGLMVLAFRLRLRRR